MDALGQPRDRTTRRLVAAAASLALAVTGAAVWRVADGDREGGRGPTARLAADAPLQLRADRDEPRSPVRSLEVPLTGIGAAAPRALARSSDGATTSRLTASRFSMVGLTWRGAGTPALRVRTHRIGGAWTAWQTAPELEDGSAQEGTPGLRATDALWVGPSDGVQVSVRGGSPRDLRLTLIDPGVLRSDATAGEETGTAALGRAPVGFVSRTTARAASRGVPMPPIAGRGKWGADPSWRNGQPTYNTKLKQVHLHHTASSNDYSAADVPAILRGIYRYHTKSLGWFDIGYNFLVDRFGRAWVGRSGGPRRLVRGAHTLGFNHQSVGIAMIGTYDTVRPSKKAVTAVVSLAAWKLGSVGADPLGTMRAQSKGSDRFPAGRRVTLPVIDGHRDTNQTACPGQRFYDLLPKIRQRTARVIKRYR